MKKIIIIVFSILIIVMIYMIISLSGNRIEVIKNKSYFDTFEIEDDETSIYCVLSIKNNSNEKISFSINADFEKDYESGLVTDRVITGIWEESGERVVTLNAGEELLYKKIVFKSQNNGCDVKNSRNLPKIEISEKKIQ